MENLLAIIILVLPGIAASYIAKMLGPSESKPTSDYEKTVIGLVFSIPGILITWGIASIFLCGATNFRNFQNQILYMPNFLIYIITVFFVALVIAFLWDKKVREKILNWTNRRRDGKRPLIYYETAWEQFVGKEKEGFIRVYQIDKKDCSVIGIFDSSWMPGDQEKGILLKCTEELKEWNTWFENPIRTYIDTNTKTVYEYFPKTAFNDAKEKVKNTTIS